ncbi:MAG: glutathione peroxidase [bacterium]|nr:glutathione peroxidase [bacterium]
MNVYDFKVLNQKNEEVSLDIYKGKVLLIVNTATKCGFTPQYEALEAMYEELKDKGFEILDFPCNQFLHQAPGSDEEINQFCSLRFNTKFPRFKKIDVKGDNADPLYKWLICQNEKNKPKNIKWNFTKFLIDRNGNVVERFGSMAKPEKFIDKVREELEK